MTRGAWIAFGTVEVLLAFACLRASQLWRDRTNGFDTIPVERLRTFRALMFSAFAWIGLFMLAMALGADFGVLVLAVLAAFFLLATVPGFGPWPLLVGLLAGGAAAARQGGLRVPVLVLSPERVEIRNWHDRRAYTWRDVRGLALVKLSPTRPPIVSLQLRTGALRRVDALFTLGSVEQKGLAGPLKREGITRT